MRIGVVGGGPAGLYFALLVKRWRPEHAVRVVEQNPADATFGFGVVFSGRAQAFLQQADPASYADIAARLQVWDDQAIVLRDREVRIDGLSFSGIARIDLLRILQRHCREAGIDLQFEERLADLTALADCDLVVGADGVHSIVRETYREQLGTSESLLGNRYVWYATEQPFDCLTLTFRENADGAFVAHHYRYAADRSTFIVECDATTWERSGLAGMSEEESLRYCERVFARELDGHRLLSKSSEWTRYRVLANRRWSCRNVVLIGDALRTVHFSVGSGTRMALQDSVALARAVVANEDVGEALRAFEAARRPEVEAFLEVAARSYDWYERFPDRLALDPVAFAYDYLTRGGRISREKLRQRSPRFAAAYEQYLAERRRAG